MKFLVLGCNGMAGHMISIYLSENGHDVTGYARTESKFVKTVIGDARDTELLKNTIEDGEYDAVINCIGILNKFAEDDHETATFLNAYLPHFLSKIAKEIGAYIIHMSTDCVFSGKKGQYKEDDLRDGESFYDRSKALGELDDEYSVTLRNSIVGPDIKESGIGLMNWFMQHDGPVKGFKHAIWTGQTTLQLAKTMEQAAIQKPHGIYNMVPDESISKYELLKLFNGIRKNPIDIIPDENFVADKSLVRTRFEGFDYKIPDYETMVSELGDWMKQHKELYPYYDL
ncbi:SDR family oxidoreductase [Candidatus Weimeria sp. HCP3S3_B5]|uniref:SDR family oxidoreductase n=1 Tax=Candidatus Weimeria sp. HCP3S3_B5 TaxID=3438871 RepID=UPI003F891123